MVQFIPARNTWSEVGENFASGLSQGYMNRSDDRALQNAIQGIENPSPRQILDAIVGTRTYSPQSKQNLLKNYLGVAEFEELKEKNKAVREENELKRLEEESKKANRIKEAEVIIENSNLPEDQKQSYLNAARQGQLDPSRIASIVTKPVEDSDYKIAQNQAKRFEKSISHYEEKAIQSEQGLPLVESAILNNESYDDAQKTWDTAIDAINSPFLNQFKSKTGQELEAVTPLSISSFGAKMSGVLTNAKMAQIGKKAVGLGKDKEANRMLLYMDYYDRKLDKLKSSISNEIIAENKYGLAPKDFDKQLEKQLKPYQKMIASDLDLILRGKQPNSPLSALELKGGLKSKLHEGEVMMISPDGVYGAVPSDQVEAAKNAKYVEVRL